MNALYPGSFDPFTNGHMDILKRSLKLFRKVTVLVAQASTKNPVFSAEERVNLILQSIRAQNVIEAMEAVEVKLWGGLVVDYARAHGVQAIVRGLRAASDFENEFMMASMNHNLNPEIETVFVMTSQDLYFVSSSMIKEVCRFGGDIARYVPAPVAQALHSRIGKKK